MNFNGYHFTGDTLRDGRPVPAIGETLTHECEIEWCRSGLYASETAWQALEFAPGHKLHRVYCEQIEQRDNDKFVCRSRTIVASIDAEPLLWGFARSCARDVLHLWDAPAVAREYLETGNEELRAAARAAARDAARAAVRAAAWAAARDAAWGAAWAAARAAVRAAAWAAARDAAWGAAWAAAQKKQRARFTRMVNASFEAQS